MLLFLLLVSLSVENQVGVVAGLTETKQELQDVSVVLENGAIFDQSIESRLGLLKEGVVEALLLGRETAHVECDLARRQVNDGAHLSIGVDGALVLGAAEKNGRQCGLKAHETALVVVADRTHDDVRPPLLVAEGRDVEEVQERVELGEAILDGRSSDDPAALRSEGARGLGRPRGLVLDGVRFVEHDAVPGHGEERA